MKNPQKAVIAHAVDLFNCEDHEYGMEQLGRLASECGLDLGHTPKAELVGAIIEAVHNGANPWAECWDKTATFGQWHRVSRQVLDGKSRRARIRKAKAAQAS